MAVTFVGAAQAGTNGTSITLTWPAVAAGDYAIVIWTSANSVTVTVDPTSQGFTQQDIQIGGTGQHRVAFYDKICTGSESGSITLTNGALNRLSAVLLVLRGAHGSNPLDTFTFFQQTVSGTNHVCPAVTTGFADCVVVTAYSERFGTTTTNVAPPGTYTERAESGAAAAGSGGTDTEIADDGYAVSRAAGSVVNPGTYVGTGSTANIKLYTISVRPAVTAVNASAEAVAVAGTAQNPTPSIGVSSEATSATLAAQDATGAVATPAESAPLTVGAQDAAPSVKPNPTEAPAAVAAADAGVQVRPGAEPALVTWQGLDATVTTSGATFASAESAAVNVVAESPGPRVSATSEHTAVGVAAETPSGRVTVGAEHVAVTVTASNASPAVGASPVTAAADLFGWGPASTVVTGAEPALYDLFAFDASVDFDAPLVYAVLEGGVTSSGSREGSTRWSSVEGRTSASTVE